MSPTRVITTDLVKMLTTCDAPVYVLDEERTIVFCNPACCRWLDIDANDLVGQHCVYHTPHELTGPAAVAALLCPPPRAFSGQPQSAMVSKATDGSFVHRRGNFLPLADGQDESSAVLAILESHDCPEGVPLENQPLEATLHAAVREFRRLAAARHAPQSLLGNDPPIVRARAQVELAAQSLASVLVIGPQGSGKRHVASAIHYTSHDSGPLVPLECSVLETNMLRSSLRSFWARAGSARDSDGTLLLIDLESAAADAQSDLLDLLRAGGARVRVVTTSTQRPQQWLESKRVSAELACRLSTMTIELAPLSARTSDLPILAQAFLEEVNAQGAKQVGGFSDEALDRLATYAWPGNVDELANTVREAHARAVGGEVTIADLPYRLDAAARSSSHPRRAEETIVLEEFLGRVERELIERAMRRSKGNKTKAARLLGLSRPRLYRRLVQLGLEQPFRPQEE